MTSWRTLRSASGYVVFVAVTVLGGVELAARQLHLGPPLNKQYVGMVADPYLPYRPAPGSVWNFGGVANEFSFETRHSAMGFRDVDHPKEKPPGTFRILGLGDSFTWGAGAPFEETYLARVERALNARGPLHPKVEIVKAGIPRFFPEPERILLEHDGLSLSPDLVTVAVLPNDVIDTWMGVDAVKPSDDGFLMTREAAELGKAGHWLFLHSNVARTVLSKWVARRIEAKRPIFWGDTYVEGGRHEEAWRKIEGELSRMKELAASRGARLVVLHIPERPPWDPVRSAYPARRLAAWAAAHGAEFVDTLPAMEKAAATEKLYWDVDPHCNGAGYGVVAEVLARALEERGLVP